MSASSVTVTELARELGLSVGTVSNALNGRGRVAAATRERVLEYAKQRGYRANLAARALRTGVAHTLELHLPSRARYLPYYMEFAFGVVDAAAAAGMDVLLTTSEQLRLGSTPGAGAVFIDCEAESTRYQELRANGIPVVAADGLPQHLPPANLEVNTDYAFHIGEVVRWAHAAGATRARLILQDPSLASRWREDVLAAFTSHCGALGVAANVQTVGLHARPLDVVRELNEHLDQAGMPELVIFAVQRLARVAARATGLGLPDSRVPWLASLVDEEFAADPPETVAAIDTHPHGFGMRCAEALIEILRPAPAAESSPPTAAESIPPTAAESIPPTAAESSPSAAAEHRVEQWPASMSWPAHWGPDAPTNCLPPPAPANRGLPSRAEAAQHARSLRG